MKCGLTSLDYREDVFILILSIPQQLQPEISAYIDWSFEDISKTPLTLIDSEPTPEPGFVYACWSGC